ncbi:flagellar biosynthetic protein FliO [Treponema primitia]|uniref:flagellar biosynthetic protein FliO n=1 Tax=Treponema primitia TaxID=88058 RepID=UPI001E2F08E0|nr:flagellar biosynthetic protein FliO [Treponema primitia]
MLFISIGLFTFNLNKVSAQTPDTIGESSVLAVEAAPLSDAPSAESLIILGDAPPGEALPAPGTPTVFVVLRMVLVLALAAAAIYGLVFFFKRLSRSPEQKNPYLKVLARAPMGAGSSVAVVSVGNKAWLVGAGDSGVSLISEITDQEMVDAMLLDDSRKGNDGGPKFLNFSALLRRLGGGAATNTRFSADDLRKRRERLKDL